MEICRWGLHFQHFGQPYCSVRLNVCHTTPICPVISPRTGSELPSNHHDSLLLVPHIRLFLLGEFPSKQRKQNDRFKWNQNIIKVYFLFFMYQAHMLTLNTVPLPTFVHTLFPSRGTLNLKLLINITASLVHTHTESVYVPFALYLHMNAYVYNNSSVPSQPNLRFSTSHGI
jgi:hypothetical protein